MPRGGPLAALLAAAAGTAGFGLAPGDIGDRRVALYRPSLLVRSRRGFRAEDVAPGCGSSFLLPNNSPSKTEICPSSCPFRKVDLHKMCHIKCITEAECFAGGPSVVGFANKETGSCEACLAIGCQECGPSSKLCAVCAPGYTLHQGACLEDMRYSWYVLYIVLVLVGLIVVCWFVRLAVKKKVNEMGLKEAEATRSFGKLRGDDEGHGTFPLYTNMCNEQVSGIAVMLHFRFQRWWIIWTFVILVASGAISYAFYNHAEQAAMQTVPGQDTNECLTRNDSEHSAMLATRMYFVWMTGVAYVLTTVLAIYFAYNQRKAFVDQENEQTNMADFGLLAKGFPVKSGGGEIEEEYNNFFKDCLGEDAVVGVSICWDYLAKSDEVVEIVKDEVDQMCDHCMLDSQGEPTSFHYLSSDDESSKHKINPDRWKIEPKNAEETKKMLTEEIKTTQFAFVVFKAESELAKAMKKYPAGTPLDKKFKGEHEIMLDHYICKPSTLLWTGFSLDRHERWVRIWMGYGAIALVIFLWALLFYGPVILYARAYWNVPGEREGNLVSALVVGFLVTLGNNLVYAAAFFIAEQARFCNFDSQEQFNTILYTIAIFVNSLVDLYIYVYAVSQGYLEDAMHGVGSDAMATNPNMQEVLYNVLFAYLVPGCLLGPFIAEILIYVFPIILGKLMVRSSPKEDMKRNDAEDMIVAPYFDMTRYGDLLNNILLVILCFFLTNVNLWHVFLWLFIGNVYIYVWDKYRVLRFTMKTEYSTDGMEHTAQYLTILPCALLASAFAFKLYGGQAMVAKWEREEFLALNAVWMTVIGTFIVHSILHFLFLKYIFPHIMPNIVESEEKHEKYQTMSTKYCASWFNANPVHCLRSRHVLAHSPPFVPFVLGKEYLQVKNEGIHQYYEHSVYKKEPALTKDAVSMAAKRAKDGLNSAGDLVGKIKHLRTPGTNTPSAPAESGAKASAESGEHA